MSDLIPAGTEQTTTVQQLNPLTFLLNGNRLIEASAGTGKTYTIANLYLRLVLGHGDSDTGFPEPLSADRILVVTFTDAATAELRDRIRAKIHDARLSFIEGSSSDPTINELIQSLDRHDERIALLQAAERQMDEAAVFTIHGFCQRMLKQHAFESGTLFSSELITDETSLLQQTTADFWRQHFYQLDKPMAMIARSVWKTPAELLSSIRSWLGQANLEVVRGQLPRSMDALQKQYIEPINRIKSLWKEQQQAIEDLLLNAKLKKNSKALSRLDEMDWFIHSDNLHLSLSGKASWEVYSNARLEADTTRAGTVPGHEVFDLIDLLVEQPLSIKDAWANMIREQALTEVRQRLKALKQRQHQMSFDDLLGNLAKALAKDDSGMLAKAIRDQFPIAMIDEFQDTDPLQYQIFSTIYGNAANDSAGLFMIGDPKQAIYAFRGADIFTYMQARQQVDDHYTLGTNWRSTRSMVACTNAMFEQVEDPFLFADIPFLPVNASPRADDSRLLLEGNPVPALQFWHLTRDKPVVSKGDYEQAMTKATANQINQLLTDADMRHCVIEKNGQTQPLQAGDIAVLVRTGRQGQMIREALAQQNIASVYLSNRESVFACQEAIDLQRLLTACLSPTDERSLRAALATPLMALSAHTLDQLNLDEDLWEDRVNEFTGYREIWDRFGVLPMLRQLIHNNQIAERLLSDNDGERRLTDLLHLGELLASASQEQETPHALLRWLSEHCQNPDSNADEQQLHLESEQNLVKIVTIHKSKGLEYNVCFLPFACDSRDAEQPVYHLPEQQGKILLDLSGNEDALSLADHERLAEDLRLMYVALTRAVHCCYVGVAPVRKGNAGKSAKTDLHKTAFGKLLSKGSDITAEDLRQKLETLAEAFDAITVSAPPLEPRPDYQPPEENTETLGYREFTGIIQKDWWVTSYSALSRSTHGSQPKRAVPSSDEQAGIDLEVQQQSEVLSELVADDYSIFSFPKGARPGTFMHTLFEKLTPEKATPEQMPVFIQEQLRQEGLGEEWCNGLVDMLNNCLDAPLDGQSMTLRQLPESSRKVEMEFYLPLSFLSASTLNKLLKQHDPLASQARELSFSTIQGMLKGFIDLVFEYQGRWYVLDYKSNWLGESHSHYSRDNMEQAMIEHRYDLQYLLYSLALHRLLKSRIPDYDYDRHFGGAIYLFLRGVQSGDDERHGIYDTRPTKQLIEAMDKLFAGEPV